MTEGNKDDATAVPVAALDDPAEPATDPDAVPSAETGPTLDLNVNGGDPITPEPTDSEGD